MKKVSIVFIFSFLSICFFEIFLRFSPFSYGITPMEYDKDIGMWHKKDFSNFEDVLTMMKDEILVKKIIENAYNDLILSGKYSYKSFIQEFENTLPSVEQFEQQARALGINQESQIILCYTSPNILQYLTHINH